MDDVTAPNEQYVHHMEQRSAEVADTGSRSSTHDTINSLNTNDQLIAATYPEAAEESNSTCRQPSNDMTSTQCTGTQHELQSHVENPRRRRLNSRDSQPHSKRQRQSDATNTADGSNDGIVLKRRARYTVEELPDGTKQVNMVFRRSISTSVPSGFALACFPEVPCEVNVKFIVDGKHNDSIPAVTGLITQERYTEHKTGYMLKGVQAVLSRYNEHTVTSMSADSSGKHLTLHLHSPEAAAAARDAASAAVTAAKDWHQHDFQDAERRLVSSSFKDYRVHVPGPLISAAYPESTNLPFRVQLSVHKDGQLLGSWWPKPQHVKSATITKKRQVRISDQLVKQLHGCYITHLKAAPPNLLQVHVSSSSGSTKPELDAGSTAAAGADSDRSVSSSVQYSAAAADAAASLIAMHDSTPAASNIPVNAAADCHNAEQSGCTGNKQGDVGNVGADDASMVAARACVRTHAAAIGAELTGLLSHVQGVKSCAAAVCAGAAAIAACDTKQQLPDGQGLTSAISVVQPQQSPYASCSIQAQQAVAMQRQKHARLGQLRGRQLLHVPYKR